tara:strand:+ start:397579 stop:397767 length:189 start_codon:yes stop_codon:yes gene_type:complete
MTYHDNGNFRSKFDPTVMDSGCYIRTPQRTPGRDDDRADFGLTDGAEIPDEDDPEPLDLILK